MWGGAGGRYAVFSLCLEISDKTTHGSRFTTRDLNQWQGEKTARRGEEGERGERERVISFCYEAFSRVCP